MSRAAGKGSAVGLAVAMGIAVGLAAPAVSSGSGVAPAPQVRPTGAAAVTLGPLDEPSAVAIAPDGSIFVAETGASRVAVFDPRGRLLRRFGRPGDGNGELRRP